MISEKALRAAGKEIQAVMIMDPPIEFKTAKVPVLTEQIKEAIEEIKPGDEFTEDTQAVIDELSGGGEEEEETPAPKKKVTKKAAPVEEEEEEEENEEEEEGSLIDQVNAAPLKLSVMTAFVKENAELKPLVKKLPTFEKASALKAAILALLEPEEEEEEDDVPTKLNKKLTSKGIKKPAVEEEEEEEEEAPKKKGGTGKTPFVARTDKSGEKYTRVMAMAEVLKAKPSMKEADAVAKADALYAKKTGAPNNPKETRAQYLKVIQVFQVLELV